MIITPAHLPAIKHATKAVKVSDRQPTDGLYAILTAEGVMWVGLTLWRLLGAQGPSQATDEALLGHGHRFENRREVDPDGGKPFPSEVDDLKAILADGQSIEVDLELPPGHQVLALVRSLERQLGNALDEPYAEVVDLPSSRGIGWKDHLDAPRDYVVRDVCGRLRCFGNEHAAPFKGKTLTRMNCTTWGYYSKGEWGVLAEREKRMVEYQEERPEPTPSAWARG